VTADPTAALLDQLAAHAEKMSRLDARHAADLAAITTRIDALAQLAAAAAPDEGNDAAAHDPAPYSPAPARRWWKLTGDDRAAAIAVLRAWVEQVYRPGYGKLAAILGPCWDQHTLCLYGVDILAELWSVLYLPAGRTPAILSAQAEYQARILPALAEQMSAETARCHHARDRELQ
jgi:hypothetical protein